MADLLPPSPTPAEILDGVRRVARDHLQIALTLEPSTDLFRDLELDSLKQLTFVVELENHFQIAFEPGDEDGLRTIGDLVNRIAGRLASAEPAPN
jgi:acyl carrier protein